MGVEKQTCTGVGFFQLFDWNKKSRKKLFTDKSDLPGESKHKKRRDGKIPMTRLHVMDDDESVSGTSFKGSSDYSCSSSVTDEEGCGTRTPGVVAKLMGLDSLPSEPSSTPYSDSQSLRDSRYCNKNFIISNDFQKKANMEPTPQKLTKRPIEKFQTEILPPKSAKSIPITHNKLLSPIKSPCFIPTKNAASIMESAAKIVETGHQAPTKNKMAPKKSSSVPIKVRELKAKVEAPQKPSRFAEVSQKLLESSPARNLKGQAMSKSWNGSSDTISFRIFSDSEDCSSALKSKGKSASLPLQSKTNNVQKREGPDLREKKENTSLHKKPTHSASNVPKQNHRKQKCTMGREKLPLNPSVRNTQGKKTVTDDSSFGWHERSIKFAGNSKVGSRKFGSNKVDDKKQVGYSGTKDVSRKKRSIDGSFHFVKKQIVDDTVINENVMPIQSKSEMDRNFGCIKDGKREGGDVVSFTFTSPLTRSLQGPETPSHVKDKSYSYSAEKLRGKVRANSNANGSGKLASLRYNVIRDDSLSILLEQKLKESTRGVESSSCKTESDGSSCSTFRDLASPAYEAIDTTHGLNADELSSRCDPHYPTDPRHVNNYKLGMWDEMDDCNARVSEARILLGSRQPSPVSVLQPSSMIESCTPSDTTDSNSTEGVERYSSLQVQDVHGTCSLTTSHLVVANEGLSDSATSTSIRTTTTTSRTDFVGSINWELDYVKEILCSVELMFTDFALGCTREILNPCLFDQLESRRGALGKSRGGEVITLRRKVLFDCTSECLDLRLKRYAGGGSRSWEKGLALVRKERLAEEVYRDIIGWRGTGDCMVDEFVDKDMSSHRGRWLDFEIEAFELGIEIENEISRYLIDEVVVDVLLASRYMDHPRKRLSFKIQ